MLCSAAPESGISRPGLSRRCSTSLALLLAEECRRVVRAGLLADYIEREEDLPILRGRLLLDRQVLRRFGRLDRLECRHDEHERDILENRILAAALRACGRRAAACRCPPQCGRAA